jgi:aerotaxis receptor
MVPRIRRLDCKRPQLSVSTHSAQEYEIGESEFLVLVSDRASNFVYANDAYLRASGYTWDELRGTLTNKMLHKDTPLQLSKDMVATVLARQPWTGVIKNQRKDGGYYWVRLNLSPLYAQGKYAGCLLVHSHVPRAEIARLEPLYRTMCREPTGPLTLRHGVPARNGRFGNLLGRVRRFGVIARVWAAMGFLSLAALSMSIASAAGTPSWLGMLGFIFAAILSAQYLSRSVIVPLRNAARFANEIAAGDLSSEMSSARSDEIGTLIRALSQMSMNLRATVVDVRVGLGLMQEATSRVAEGALDLSERTDSQASHLQQAAASMEEIHATVSRTADASGDASRCAASARSAAEDGGRVIGQVIATMEGITRSSKHIADIVGVIDSIAFQTNILALNAAVEAARAGEQGKGFAVVAGEVRSLAQRSAQSAREIRALIFESVKQVDTGAAMVSSAGKTMTDVVAQVRRVTELVTSIAEASRQQSAGVAQITDGVNSLEGVTQQNVELVQQSTASAQSLRSQAERLAEAVAVFKLSQSESLALFNASRSSAEEVRQAVLTTRAA